MKGLIAAAAVAGVVLIWGLSQWLSEPNSSNTAAVDDAVGRENARGEAIGEGGYRVARAPELPPRDNKLAAFAAEAQRELAMMQKGKVSDTVRKQNYAMLKVTAEQYRKQLIDNDFLSEQDRKDTEMRLAMVEKDLETLDAQARGDIKPFEPATPPPRDGSRMAGQSVSMEKVFAVSDEVWQQALATESSFGDGNLDTLVPSLLNIVALRGVTVPESAAPWVREGVVRYAIALRKAPQLPSDRAEALMSFAEKNLVARVMQVADSPQKGGGR